MVWTHCILSVDGHLGSFQFLAIVNDAPVHIHVQVLCGRMFSFPLGICLGSGLSES